MHSTIGQTQKAAKAVLSHIHKPSCLPPRIKLKKCTKKAPEPAQGEGGVTETQGNARVAMVFLRKPSWLANIKRTKKASEPAQEEETAPGPQGQPKAAVVCLRKPSWLSKMKLRKRTKEEPEPATVQEDPIPEPQEENAIPDPQEEEPIPEPQQEEYPQGEAYWNSLQNQDPKIIQVPQGNALLLSPELEQEVVTALQHYRETDELQRDLNDEVDDLKIQFDALEEQLVVLRQRLDAGDEQVAEEIRGLEQEQQALVERREAAHQQFHYKCLELRNDQRPLMEMLWGAFAEQMAALYPPEEAVPAENIEEADQGESPWLAQAPGCDNSVPEALPVPWQPPPPPPQHERLNSKYKMLLSFLDQAEIDLEYRHDQFDRQRQTGYINEERISTISELERRQFIETQRMTRNITRFENEIEAVRNEAFEAGVQLDAYDIESRFIDDVNDGYGMSGEREMIASVDVAKMEKWLAQLPENPMAADLPARPVVPDEDWDAASVDIHDSVSMVAEGAQRKRIDRWSVWRENPEIILNNALEAEERRRGEGPFEAEAAPATPKMGQLQVFSSEVGVQAPKCSPKWKISPQKGGEGVDAWGALMRATIGEIGM